MRVYAHKSTFYQIATYTAWRNAICGHGKLILLLANNNINGIWKTNGTTISHLACTQRALNTILVVLFVYDLNLKNSLHVWFVITIYSCFTADVTCLCKNLIVELHAQLLLTSTCKLVNPGVWLAKMSTHRLFLWFFQPPLKRFCHSLPKDPFHTIAYFIPIMHHPFATCNSNTHKAPFNLYLFYEYTHNIMHCSTTSPTCTCRMRTTRW